MPHVLDRSLDSVIYLYRNAVDAKRGAHTGGSGFLVGVKSKKFPDGGWIYAVTNAHVIEQGFRTIRLNTKDGDTDYLPEGRLRWTLHPDGDDVAICNVALLDKYRFHVFEIENTFVTEALIQELNLGAGDDVMMYGRFIGLSGLQQNRPVIRSGIISAMPAVEIEREGKSPQLSYLIECKSISGFSGSPVVVYRKPRYPDDPRTMIDGQRYEFRAWLLGIDWCHLPVEEEVYQRDQASAGLRPTNYTVQSNSGIAAIVPVSKLYDLLYDKRVEKLRLDEEAIMERKVIKPNMPIEDLAKDPMPATQRTLAPKEKDRIDIPIPTKGDVMDVFKKASRKLEKK